MAGRGLATIRGATASDRATFSDGEVSQRTVARFLGTARVLKLRRCGWLVPVDATGRANAQEPPILFRARDVQVCVARLERGQRPSPDRIEIARVRESERRHGRSYVRRTDAESEPDFASIDVSEL